MTAAGPQPTPPGHESARGMRVLAVDDEAPSLADLVFELRALDEVAEVIEAHDANEALRALRATSFDAVFLDVRMPGLDGLELARVLAQFKEPPPVVFVTAFDVHAVDAFEIDAVDYLLKPVRRERLRQAVSKISARPSASSTGWNAAPPPVPGDPSGASLSAPNTLSALTTPDAGTGLQPVRHPLDEETIPIESGGRIRVVARRDVQYVSSSGDYVRLHVGGSSALLRAAMSTLEERWASAGFVRIHRGYLVALAHIDEVRVEPGRGYIVRIGDRSLPVSRRLAAQLRARLIEDAARRSRP